MEQDTPSSVVISSLICQLLEANTSILDQSRYQELSRKFVMGDLLNIFPEVYILLDRVDRIKGDADLFMDPLLGFDETFKMQS